MDEQMPRAAEDGAERAEEVVENQETGAKPSEGSKQGEADAARDATGDEDWQEPEEPGTTVD